MSGIPNVCPMLHGRMNVGRKESSEAQANIPADDDKWVESIENAGETSGCRKAQIHKVLAMLQDKKEFSKYCKPRVVSIGPYHHNNLVLRKEEIKRKMAKDFATNSHIAPTIKATIKGWNSKIKGQIQEWRECYEENSTNEHDNPTLARMMLLDGCFILQYVDKITSKQGHEGYFQGLKMKSHEVALVQQDLFLLDNQLPYGVLKTLMAPKEQEWRDKIQRFIAEEIIKFQEGDKLKNPLPHLEPDKPDPSHLLEFLRELLLGCPTTAPIPPKNRKTWHSFRNIKELIAVGIELIPSDSYCLRNVTYTPSLLKGYLNLPPIIVDDSTAAKFLNLIAYEMCPGAPDDFEIKSYICFMDSLIDLADDVKQLRDARILHNFLGSDQEVAELFNKIGTDLVPNSEVYGSVKVQIQRHYDSKVRSWVALFIHDHFSTPWTFLAFMAAIFALATSGVQTYYSAVPPPGPCDDFCTHL